MVMRSMYNPAGIAGRVMKILSKRECQKDIPVIPCNI